MARFTNQLKHAWNVFIYEQNPKQGRFQYQDYGPSTTYRPDRSYNRLVINERSIIGSIYNRIGIDGASFEIRHIRTDDLNRYLSDMPSGLNNCFRLEANVDQAARQFRQDIVQTLIERGVCAIVPIDTTINPFTNGGYDIQTLRVGHIVSWYPEYVRVWVYNEKVGHRQEILVPKSSTAIVENPLYSIMNEPNSTLQRLVRKLDLLDAVDEQSSSGKLDLIIQLPYVVKSEARRQQAQQRRDDIEFQLKGSKYGVAYTDGTEKVTQLNRPATNNLMDQVTYLTDQLYAQLGLTPGVMNGTAQEPEMLNYWNRTVEPILDAVVESMRRTFLTKTARSQNQDIQYFRNPFKLIPIGGEGGIADIANSLSRNEIMSPNEFRSILGLKPDPAPKSDQLNNSNMPLGTGKVPDTTATPPVPTTLPPAVQNKPKSTNSSGSKGTDPYPEPV